MAFDDSALFHRAAYDPAKAREYYLRTRRLKGRRRGASDEPSGDRRGSGGASNAVLRDSRREQLEARKEALENKLEQLRDILREAVEDAKKRSDAGKGEENSEKEGDKSTETKDPKEKADKNEQEKSKLTEQQKREKREASREQYARENRTTLSKDVQVLETQIKDIRAKITNALAEAREKSSSTSNQTAPNRR